MRVSDAALAALMLLVWGSEARAQGSACTAPPAWSATAARPGRPFQEVAACLRSEAYKARGLHVPVDSVANGIAASCEVEVDRIQGSNFFFHDLTKPEAEQRAREDYVMQHATAAVTQYQACPR